MGWVDNGVWSGCWLCGLFGILVSVDWAELGPWLCNISSCGSDGLFDGSQGRVDSLRLWFLGGFAGCEVDLWWFCL